MVQLFNTPGHPPPNQNNLSHPPNTFNGHVFRRKPKYRFHIKIFAVIAGMLVLIGLPSTLYLVNHSQDIRQHAQVYQSSTHDSCNKLTITASELPVCPRLNGHGTQHINDYTWTANIKSNDGKPHSVILTQYSDFCTGPYATGNPSQCDQNPIMRTLTVNTPYTVVIQRSPTTGSACGTYQADLHISSIDNNTNCTYSGKNIGASGLCETGIACHATTPTPTPKPGVTFTPTPKSTPTLTPTTPPNATSTPTPTECITPGVVQNVKVTCANCSSSQQ